MSRTLVKIVLAICLFVALLGFGLMALNSFTIGEDTPMPSDEALSSRPYVHRAALEDLVRLGREAPGAVDLYTADLQDRSQRGIENARGAHAAIPERPARTGSSVFTRSDANDLCVIVWYGTGINAPRRGYAYAKKRPIPFLASTTNERDPLWYRYTYLYREIGRGWYIWYDTSIVVTKQTPKPKPSAADRPG